MSAHVAPITDTFPALSEMGINRFHEISHYTLRSNGKNKDTLRVHYKREKGSFLPQSRKYCFGRSLKTVIVDGGTAKMAQSYEISPFLLKAVSELDSLVSEKLPKSGKKSGTGVSKQTDSHLLDEINTLEQWVLEAVDAESATHVLAGFERLRSHASVQTL